MGGISQTSSKRRFEEMEYAMKQNGRNWMSTFIFIGYLKLRTLIRNLLDRINPDLKSRIVTKRKNT